ncbi:hypothetical protein [Jiella marina]|uniref:hypothetical protein n=1 Tax=Jiella sp. LLJ827 TaxID=2917712 RepID=UPI002101B267|nr:hypothetical protein [Jiella sp. LLJ827]MCQ0988942.1 hypothetical protein [Jiella sp. LLJ827]
MAEAGLEALDRGACAGAGQAVDGTGLEAAGIELPLDRRRGGVAAWRLSAGRNPAEQHTVPPVPALELILKEPSANAEDRAQRPVVRQGRSRRKRHESGESEGDDTKHHHQQSKPGFRRASAVAPDPRAGITSTERSARGGFPPPADRRDP